MTLVASFFGGADPVAGLTARMAPMLGTYFGGVAPDPTVLSAKLAAGVAELQRKLRFPIVPTYVFPGPSFGAVGAMPASEQQFIPDASMPFMVESGYDLPPGFLGVGQWGNISLYHRPVLQVIRIDFTYPGMPGASFTCPDSWMQLDRKGGRVHFFPVTGYSEAPISMVALQAVYAAQTIPLMVKARYVAGVDPSLPENADIVEAAYRMAMIQLLRDTFLPQSGSVSVDGLSQSVSADVDKLSATLDATLDTIRERVIGLTYGVL